MSFSLITSDEECSSTSNSALDDATLQVTQNISGKELARLEYNCWTHPDSVLTLETFMKMDKTIQCGLIPSVFLIGAPTNIVSMIIFYRQGLRDRMNLCLFCLTLADFLYIASQFISVFYCFIESLNPSQGLFWRWTLLIHSLNVIYGFIYLSGCVTMIIAVERCVCVMFPMKAATLISTKTMAIILALTFLLIHGLCSVYAVKEKISFVTDPVSKERIFSTTNTELYRSHSIFKVVEDIVLSIVSFFTFIVVLTATVITVVQLRNALAWRKSTTSGSSYLKGQAVLLRMLVAVSFIYVLCTAPNVALALTRFSVPEFRANGAQCSIFLATHMLGFIISMLNSSINFFVYITMSSRFRRELKMLWFWQTSWPKVNPDIGNLQNAIVRNCSSSFLAD